MPSSPPISHDLNRPIALGFLIGIIHLFLVGGLWLWFGFADPLQGTYLMGAYLAIGAVLLGAIPTFLFLQKRLVAPAIVVVVAFLVTAAQTWAIYVAPPMPPAPVDPTPFGWYALGWVVLLAVSLVIAGGEYGLRQISNPQNGG